MQGTKFDTLTINAIGSKAPTKLAQAGNIVLRVVLRNVGAGVVFVAGAPEEVNPQDAPSTGTFRLFAGAEEVFVVPPRNSLYALAVGSGARVSVSTSEAIPTDILKS